MTTTGCDTWRSLEGVVGADFAIVKNVTLRAEYRALVYSAPDFDFDKNVWRAGLVQVLPERKLRLLPHDRRSAGLAASLLNDILGTMVLVLVVGAISPQPSPLRGRFPVSAHSSLQHSSDASAFLYDF